MSSAATSNDGEIETVEPHKEEEIDFFLVKEFLSYLAYCLS